MERQRMTLLPGLHCPPVEAHAMAAIWERRSKKVLVPAPRSTTVLILIAEPFRPPMPPLPRVSLAFLDKKKALGKGSAAS